MSSHDAGAHVEHYDPQANKIGMWTFLFTEGLLFGVLFITFFVYLGMNRWDFMACSSELNRVIGGINTLVLLTSSLTMALSIGALQRGKQGLSLGFMVATIAFAGVFLVIKYFEWSHKIHIGIYPRSEVLTARTHGAQLFYGLYYVMTGLHGLRVIIGAALIAIAMVFVKKGKVHAGRISFIENVGLYWHLVDLVWIYLFPMFYLIGRPGGAS